MTDPVVKKYNMLNRIAKQEVNDFMDFLLSKQKSDVADSLSYRNRIMKVSKWSDSDLRIFSENQKLFNQWNVQEW